MCGWFWRKGAIYKFSGGTAKTFRAKKKWIWLFALTFVSFGQAKEKIKDDTDLSVESRVVVNREFKDLAEREILRVPRGAWSIFLTRFFVSFSSMEKDRNKNSPLNIYYSHL